MLGLRVHHWAISLAAAAVLFFAFETGFAQDKPQYKKNEIRDARFGDDQKQAAIQIAYELDEAINAEIFGQEHVSQAFRDKLVQYLESFGRRQGEPVAINLMGLPGIG